MWDCYQFMYVGCMNVGLLSIYVFAHLLQSWTGIQVMYIKVDRFLKNLLVFTVGEKGT